MNNPWYTPALRGALGDWVFYPSLLSASQLSEHVLPSKDIRESKILDDYLQRDLNPRVNKIVRYLKTRDTRFFNAILLGIFDGVPDWAELNFDAVRVKLNLSAGDSTNDSLGLLKFTGSEKIFAIDGQHRAEGIRKGNDEFADRLAFDQYPVIFLAHSDTKDGKVRTRRLFCDINKNAVPVSKGDRVIIDEDDLSAIVTRRIYADYPRFKGGDEIAVTEKTEHVAKDDKEYFTSLLGVFTVCKKLEKLFKREHGTQAVDPANVAAFQAIVSRFFDFIIDREPSLRKYFIHHTTTPAQERERNRNLVFRPVGLELLARLYVHFVIRGREVIFGWALENIKWENPEGVWDGTVWSAGRIRTKAKAAAFSHVLYLLNEMPPDEELAHLEELRLWRQDPQYALPAKLEPPALA